MSAAHRTTHSTPHGRPGHRRNRRHPHEITASPLSSTASTTSTPDYAQQLHAAILTTREAILTQHSTADAGRGAALGGLAVARRTFADARIGLKNANATNMVTAFLDQKLGDANQTALNAVALAENANTE